MPLPEPLMATLGVVAAVTAMLVDGKRAVDIAVLALSLGLLPTAISGGGSPALLLFGSVCVVTLGGSALAGRAARHLPWVAGLDPLVPVFASSRHLFGPRSVRVWAAALALPAASWVSLYIPLGDVTSVQGVLFPIAYASACGLLRILIARTLEDAAVGSAVVGIASATAWLLRGTPDALMGAALLAALAPASALAAAWLRGRHARRPATE